MQMINTHGANYARPVSATANRAIPLSDLLAVLALVAAIIFSPMVFDAALAWGIAR